MEEFARAVLLLFAIALIINLIKNGPDGVKDWLRAKFLGREPAPAGPPGPSGPRGAHYTPPRRSSPAPAGPPGPQGPIR